MLSKNTYTQADPRDSRVMDRKVQGVCWASTNPDTLIQIFSKLDHDSLLSAARVCRAWCSVSNYPECWDFVHSSKHNRFLDNNIKETGIPDHDRLVEQSAYIFRYAGVRAKSISVFPEADDSMLQKIADRCPSIESISLRDCTHISAAAIAYLAHTCKHLKLIDLNLAGARKYLQISGLHGFQSRAAAAVTVIEEIGRSCPDLVGINLSGWRVTREMATAIGTFMPKLNVVGSVGIILHYKTGPAQFWNSSTLPGFSQAHIFVIGGAIECFSCGLISFGMLELKKKRVTLLQPQQASIFSDFKAVSVCLVSSYVQGRLVWNWDHESLAPKQTYQSSRARAVTTPYGKHCSPEDILALFTVSKVIEMFARQHKFQLQAMLWFTHALFDVDLSDPVPEPILPTAPTAPLHYCSMILHPESEKWGDLVQAMYRSQKIPGQWLNSNNGRVCCRVLFVIVDFYTEVKFISANDAARLIVNNGFTIKAR
ncbi:hypothetical protein ACLOJK_011241 [Asimina triloba]